MMSGILSSNNGRVVGPRTIRALATHFVASVTVTASVVGTTETVMATYSIPAGFTKLGDVFHALYSGIQTATGVGSPSVRFRIRVGGLAGTVLADSGTISNTSAGMTNAGWRLEGDIACRAVGASGVLWAALNLETPGTTPSTGVSRRLGPGGTIGIGQSSDVTVDLTVAQDIVLTMEYSANTASNSIQLDLFTIDYKPAA